MEQWGQGLYVCVGMHILVSQFLLQTLMRSIELHLHNPLHLWILNQFNEVDMKEDTKIRSRELSHEEVTQYVQCHPNTALPSKSSNLDTNFQFAIKLMRVLLLT